ncbi:TPA: Rrf2 family transcriptional regulator [Klebsiella quasipneumoniae subsp. similipneumoniae]|uniref:Rrf2 family transcriptional regulator n=1 Tax=Klebsiella pneumoniae complex TaxID=3390273 RepID=UPI0009F05FC7|nr:MULTISPECIES: Rrf2 family transcriptional regulator [Klebsiella]HDH1412213.1 Rrf2 family transcriptional regulator [Klebsiella quasipneumoniae subsp. similipneumoniae]MBC4775736.1 Rrf2 family transcriptional regulator [Klebsiella pneumoniae]MCE7418445.1 Rrf2 family transcriptional regulator [Klebsiella pneumoniae]MCM6021736.1 Rrf2 family transcriptional regulator [Klebsiella pneumoniae]MCP6252692.1 Rrf2 family transcriptional regulator [Klebsiella pneumoniae]
MRSDTRLSRVLHVLVHLACDEGNYTSQQLAEMLDTNPVLVRRSMAGLREAGYVRSEKGHNGGWSLSCDPAQVTLLDIYKAVGITHLYHLGINRDDPHCLIENTVNDELDDALKQAEMLLMTRLNEITLSHLCRKFKENKR